MRRRSQKFLGIVLVGVVAIGMFCATSAFAQEAGAEGRPRQKSDLKTCLRGVFQGKFWFDPVFYVIGILSILGLTLIIQGFIKNRHSVLMPDETTEQIREMIGQKKFKELLEFTRDEPSFISKVLQPRVEPRPGVQRDEGSDGNRHRRADRRPVPQIEYLNIVGNLGPLLGLLERSWV